MGNRRISADLKESALLLWNQGWDLDEICAMYGVSRASMYRWESYFNEHGNLDRPPSPIRGQSLRILTRALIIACEQLFAEESDLYLDEVATWLAHIHGIHILKSTLCRNLQEIGLTRKILQKAATERNEVQREAWRETIRTDFRGDGMEFVCVDETSKNEHTWARHYGRARSGQRAPLSDVFVRGDWYSLAAALTIEGYMAVHVVEGSFNGPLFFEFIATKVLPYMNPFPAENSVLVLDNCRIHHNEDLVNLVRDAGCLLLYLPPYSPDLMPIEESFSTYKAYLRCHAHRLRNDEDPIRVMLDACGCVTGEMAVGWFRHAGFIVR